MELSVAGLNAIKVLLVDDQPAVRRGLRMRLALEADVVVVGEAGDGEEGIALAKTLQPDVVLMDTQMPTMDGIAATEAITGQGLTCAVVILSLYDDARTQNAARAAGAAAFVDKYSGADVLLAAIRQAAAKNGSRGPLRSTSRARSARPARTATRPSHPRAAGLYPGLAGV